MSDKFLMFTWQPTWILIEGDECALTGVESIGETTYTKADKFFKQTVTAGARLSHDRQWELLAVRALTGGDVTLQVIDPVGLDKQAIKPLSVIPANTEAIMNKVFGAGEELLVSTVTSPGSVMCLVREYSAGNGGL